ncbi:similar to Saccharomyces cerevisiae YHR113W APE4 Cytoplasmic aspartyl aminopeptidase that may also function in the vacuole [Maudiozyma saulgeensis]|uniref:aspartyl aminopeptidase n=1 Tax=Maudiozyma saulgeensis TaxID=1789683 RepID=A0A1X7QXP1_9SACH|nr:similar to Saccharomyces cerevisiae YHR113W APE4 Cytoplasmic aspartyl aminopeptidase that may also function in the vacuole [Kazachstania saulgeensis]
MLRLHIRKMSSVSKPIYQSEFVNFLNASHSPYHAVHSIKKHLISNGFEELSERDQWNGKVKHKGKYYVTRNNSSIIAFVVGNMWQPGNPLAIVGAHTDSPVLRIKPISKRVSEKYTQIGVECYGGGVWHSWFDSDLSIAGRVMVNDTKTGKVVAKLIDLNKPLLKIPTLAIHLDRSVNEKFVFNKETNLLPLAGLACDSEVSDKKEVNESSDDAFNSIKSIVERHNKELLDLIQKELELTSVEQIEDFELILYDNKESCLGGLKEEFIFSGRLDNLTSCFTGMHALTEAADLDIEKEKGIRLFGSFDHEEIGSSSAQGADSNFLPNIMERLCSLKADNTDIESPLTKSLILESSAKSFFLSSDVAHAVHPNYATKHESKHKPIIGSGPVLKINANQRYMTNSPGIVLIKKMADTAKVPLQLFVAANDSPCGSTIGPILASKTGIRTLDLGNPILSMHSIRETGGAADLGYQIKLFQEFFKSYSSLESEIIV